MPHPIDDPPFDGEVKNNTINVHYHPNDSVHWKLALSRGDDQSVSEVDNNELDLDTNEEHRLLVVNVDETSAHDFQLTLQGDNPAARLRSEGLAATVTGDVLEYTFSLPKKDAGQPASEQEFSYQPSVTDTLSTSATGDDPRFKIKLKT